jgi:hypothetical protein
MWADCHDYEKLSAGELTDTHYTELNPAFGKNPKLDPTTQQPFKVGLNDKISYYWQNSNYSIIFPYERWPTPADLWGLGTEEIPGWDGIYYRYGPDELVMLTATQENCVSKNWFWVNYTKPITELSTEPRTESSTHKPTEFFQIINLTLTRIPKIVGDIDDNFKTKLAEGLDYQEALRQLSYEACEMAPTLEVTDYVREWFEMTGIDVDEVFERGCDSTVREIHDGVERLTEVHSRQKLNVETVEEKINPLIISGAVLGIILVVVGIIFILKKNREKSNNTIN